MPFCSDLKPYGLRVRQSLLIGSHVFRVGVGEAEELVLVQVHYDKFVCRSQVDRHLGELFVKVASVPAVPLQGGGGLCDIMGGGGRMAGGGGGGTEWIREEEKIVLLYLLI